MPVAGGRLPTPALPGPAGPLPALKLRVHGLGDVLADVQRADVAILVPAAAEDPDLEHRHAVGGRDDVAADDADGIRWVLYGHVRRASPCTPDRRSATPKRPSPSP